MKQKTEEVKEEDTQSGTTENKLSNDSSKSKENADSIEQKVEEEHASKENLDDSVKISNLTVGLGNLNIAHEEDEGDTDEHCSKKKDFKKRGPNGGIAMQRQIPMGPHGNYVPPQPYHQLSKPLARPRDDDDYLPTKFMNPGCQINPPFSQADEYLSSYSQIMPAVPFNNLQCPDFSYLAQQPISSQITNKNTYSGGQVTVQSPVQNMQQPFADFDVDLFDLPSGGLPSATISEHPTPARNNDLRKESNSSPGGYVYASSIPSPFSDCSSTDFTGPQFETRRPADIDSGVESAEERSPYSEQAPSPPYPSPLSVDSGYARSPLHEIPNFEDSSDTTLNPELNDRLNLAWEVIQDLESKEDKQKIKNAQHKQQQQQLHQQHNFIGTTQFVTTQSAPVFTGLPKTAQSNKPIKASPKSETQPQPFAMVIPTTTAQPGTAVPVTATGQIIFIAPTPIVQHTPKKGLRKILPKLPQSGAGETGSNGITPTTSSSSKSVSNLARKAPNKTQQQAQGTSQVNKSLLFARRQLANHSIEDLTRANNEGDTCLHLAVCGGNCDQVQALLERFHRENLDNLIDQENLLRQTPLYMAVILNMPEMVSLFVRFQADVNVLAQCLSTDRTVEVKAAIHVAAIHGDDYLETLVQLLKAKDISINIVNSYGQTALHSAILAHGKAKKNSNTERINSIETIKTLIKAGADPSAQDKKSGKTPLMYAIEQCCPDLVETILTTVEPANIRNVVRTQAFDGSSCLKIAEGLRCRYNSQIWNRLWNSLHSAASGTMSRIPLTAEFALAT